MSTPALMIPLPIPVSVEGSADQLPNIFKAGSVVVAYGLIGTQSTALHIYNVSGLWIDADYPRPIGNGKNRGWIYVPSVPNVAWGAQ